MADLAAIDRIADFLPDSERERFLRIVARLKDVPEDDEYLLVLEAIGFISLILKEIPDRVKDVLAASAPADEGGANGSSEYLLRRISEEIPKAVQLPNLEDLRLLFHEFATANASLREDIRNLDRRLGVPATRSKKSLAIASRWIAAAAFGMALAIGALSHSHFQSRYTDRVDRFEHQIREVEELVEVIADDPHGALTVEPGKGFAVSGSVRDAFIDENGRAVVLFTSGTQ